MSVNFLDFGTKLGEALGIGSFGGGLLATTIMIFTALACLGALTRKSPTPLQTIIVSFPLMGFCVYAGWAPVWLFIVLMLIIAFLYSERVVGIFRRF